MASTCSWSPSPLFGPPSGAPGCWRPYSARSPFNRALPADPPQVKRSQRIVRRMLRSSRPKPLVVGYPEGNEDDYGHPIYYARLLDPMYEVRCIRWIRSCEVHGRRVRIPAAALPASGSDAALAVIDAGRDWEYDFWQVRTVPLPPSGGRITISHGGRTRWGARDADGLGSNATAAHFGLAAGMIRAEEWEAATAHGAGIEHALFIGVPCTSGRSVYPAAPRTTGTSCPTRRRRANAPPLGGRLYLDMSEHEIDMLPVPPWKKPILKAMARYGMIIGETGGGRHAFSVWAESDRQYRAFGGPGRYAELGAAWAVPTYEGAYYFEIASGVDWRSRLRVVRPCVSGRGC